MHEHEYVCCETVLELMYVQHFSKYGLSLLVYRCQQCGQYRVMVIGGDATVPAYVKRRKS